MWAVSSPADLHAQYTVQSSEAKSVTCHQGDDADMEPVWARSHAPITLACVAPGQTPLDRLRPINMGLSWPVSCCRHTMPRHSLLDTARRDHEGRSGLLKEFSR